LGEPVDGFGTTSFGRYFELDQADRWRSIRQTEVFALLMEFIATLPFASTARALIIFDAETRAVPAHRDHHDTDRCHEFIWFRTNLDKRF